MPWWVEYYGAFWAVLGFVTGVLAERLRRT